MGNFGEYGLRIITIRAKENSWLSIQEKQDCFKCIHFYITWRKDFPNGCKIYGIQTKHFPSLVVLSSTGTGCKGFAEKPKKNRGNCL